jgi:hypothetical protein
MAKLQADHAELSGSLVTAQLYFGPDAVAAIGAFGNYLNSNQQIRGRMSMDVAKAMQDVAAKKKTPEDFFLEWSKQRGDAASSDEYNRLGIEAVTTMAKEIADNLGARE